MDQKKLSERIREDRISSKAHMTGRSPNGLHYQWDVTLMCQGRVFRLPDPFESANEPTTFDVLDLLTGACGIVDQCADRDEWAQEYIPDGDPEHQYFTERDWRTWQKINKGLIRLLGPERHQEYLYDTDCNDE